MESGPSLPTGGARNTSRFALAGNNIAESDVRFSVAPIYDVPKIEHRRFSALPCNKKSVLG